MKILIIGYGSIAKKHVFAIKSLVDNPIFYALRSKSGVNNEEGINNIFNWDDIPNDLEFCIISNPTLNHYETIKAAANLNIPLFIEKPSLMSLNNSVELLELIEHRRIKTYVGFNLRYHPAIIYIKSILNRISVIETNIYFGSYLPDWRHNVDYSEVYSAKKKMGGGVHLDLIHEIDYAIDLFGIPSETVSLKRRVSSLKIDSFDFAHYNLIYPNNTINITLNYFRKTAKRSMEIVHESGVLNVDLLNNEISNELGGIIYKEDFSILDTYINQMKYFINFINSGEAESNNTFSDSLVPLKICLK